MSILLISRDSLKYGGYNRIFSPYTSCFSIVEEHVHLYHEIGNGSANSKGYMVSFDSEKAASASIQICFSW